MFEKIAELERRFEELESLLSDPEILANQNEFRRLSKEHSGLAALVAAFREYKKILADMEDNRELLKEPDQEMREMAQAELLSLEERHSTPDNRELHDREPLGERDDHLALHGDLAVRTPYGDGQRARRAHHHPFENSLSAYVDL